MSIEVKMVVVLMNKGKEGWDPARDTSIRPEYYRPGHPYGDYITGPFEMRTKILGEQDFDDKFMIYQVSLHEYIDAFWNPEYDLQLGNVEFLYRPFSEGEYRGVAV